MCDGLTVGAEGASVSSGAEEAGVLLAERVFTGEERWGWEYVEPPSPVLHPDAGNPPVWQEPVHPPLVKLERRRAKRQSALVRYFWILVAAAVLARLTGLDLFIAVALVVIVIAGIPEVWLSWVRSRAKRQRALLLRQHEGRTISWQRQIDEHMEKQRLRAAAADLWFPLQLDSRPRRIDVFGGTGDSWASLLATVGGPLLRGGHGMLIMDLSQQAIAMELAGMAAHHQIPVSHVPLPSSFTSSDLLDGFTPDELAESLAEALATLRPPGADIDLQSIDVDLMHTTAKLLDSPVTYERLAAGLRVLLRVYDPAASGDVLSPQEVEKFSRAIDTVGQGERVQNELNHVRGQMELMAKAQAAQGKGLPEGQWCQRGRLTIVSTDDPVDRRKDLTDRIAFFRLLQFLRQRRIQSGDVTLVLAGVDHLGRAALESMARQARSAGVRLVLMLEHLREDTVKVAGGPDSATVFMKLGNGEEARSAAQFIGQEHKFLVNQLTRQVGETLTEGRSSSYGGQEGESVTDTTSEGGSSTNEGWFGLADSRGRNWGNSRSVTTSLSRSWQESTSTSQARSVNRGENESRVYEFTVEPTHIQSLPVTGLVLVETVPGGRRVVFGDCNPGITGLPRLSDGPRREPS
jgi:hypothetical protein